jgi:hypothetical protein
LSRSTWRREPAAFGVFDILQGKPLDIVGIHRGCVDIVHQCPEEYPEPLKRHAQISRLNEAGEIEDRGSGISDEQYAGAELS